MEPQVGVPHETSDRPEAVELVIDALKNTPGVEVRYDPREGTVEVTDSSDKDLTD